MVGGHGAWGWAVDLFWPWQHVGPIVREILEDALEAQVSDVVAVLDAVEDVTAACCKP